MRFTFLVLGFSLSACARTESTTNKAANPLRTEVATNTPAVAAAPGPSSTVRSPGAGGATVGGADTPAAQAEQIYTATCASCHGQRGIPEGPMAMLIPKPRNFVDAAWQSTAKDDDMRAIIVKGGQGVGKSPLMPPMPALANQPAVLDALIARIRAFGKPPE
jgi:mono/diheme cytochrome c family protein